MDTLRTRALTPHQDVPGTAAVRNVTGPLTNAVSGLGIGERRMVRIAGDLVAITSPWILASIPNGFAIEWLPVATAIVAWFLATLVADPYRSLLRGSSTSNFIGAMSTLVLAAAVFVTIQLALPLGGLSAGLHAATAFGFFSDFVIAAALLAGWQAAYGFVVQGSDSRRRILVVGNEDLAISAASLLRNSLSQDYTIVGFVADESVDHVPAVIDGMPVLGRVDGLSEIVREHRIGQIILAADKAMSNAEVDLLSDALESGVVPTTLFDLYQTATGRVPLSESPALRLAALTAAGDNNHVFYAAIKRLTDIAISLVGMTGVALVVPFVALANAIESPGPLFYGQRRIGRGGREFTILKFRSMVVNAEVDGRPQWCATDDHRITRIGKILRKTHLDETPQFWNVLKGDMSFVGPRPERPEIIRELRNRVPCYGARHAVRPGLTGWAQVNYRYGNTLEDVMSKLEFDLYYIQRRSIWLDLVCVLRTVRTVVLMTGV